jgi:hypothetical protein
MLLDNQQDGGYTVEENTLEEGVMEFCKNHESAFVDYEYNIYEDGNYTIIQIKHINKGEITMDDNLGMEFAYKNNKNFTKKSLHEHLLRPISEGEEFERVYVDE